MRGVFGASVNYAGQILGLWNLQGKGVGKVGDFCRKVLYFCRKTDNFLPLMDNLRRIVVASVYQEEEVQVNPVDISLNCV